MKTPILFTSILQRPTTFPYREKLWEAKHIRSKALNRYADWRVGATASEKRAYKSSDSILLTFDDYGTAQQVERLLQILDHGDIRAMFFLQGDWADENPKLVENIAKAGHIVGNHTYSHPDLLSLSNDEVRTEILSGPQSTWLRPPRGRFNSRIRQVADELGYRICYWTIDSDDWQGVSTAQITRKVMAELHPGAVILFHLHATNTLEVLPSLIASVRSRGFELCNKSEQLGGPSK